LSPALRGDEPMELLERDGLLDDGKLPNANVRVDEPLGEPAGLEGREEGRKERVRQKMGRGAALMREEHAWW
jgi:hypothetical protein